MSNPTGTQVVERCTQLLRLVANANQQGARVVDLWQLSGLRRSTAMRLLSGLEANGLVRRVEKDKRYLLGPLVYELGLAANRAYQQPPPVLEWLGGLAQKIGDTVYLVRRSGDDSVCVARVEGPYPVQVKTVDVGTRRPMGASAGGLAILTALAPAEIRAIVARNRTQLRPYEELYRRSTRMAISDTLRQGYVYMPTHIAPRVSALAVSVPGASDYAVSTSALDFRLSKKATRVEAIQHMRETAEGIAPLLGRHSG